MARRVGFLGTVGLVLYPALAWCTDPVAVLTEFRAGQGEVQIRRVGEAEWRTPQPFLALRPGDELRATGDARGVVVFTGGQGSLTVSQANSPMTIRAPAGGGPGGRVRDLVTGITQFLLGRGKEPTYQALAVRAAPAPPPVIVSPRGTRLLPGSVTFEWAGSDRLRYKLRLHGPAGVAWEQTALRRQPVEYPASAPALQPGQRYRWELETEGHPVQQADFEIVPLPEAQRVRATLDELRPGSLTGYPTNTVVLLRAAFLFQEGFYHEARQELRGGIAADPDEPALHELLGHVYDRVGLRELAAQEFDEARFLSTARP